MYDETVTPLFLADFTRTPFILSLLIRGRWMFYVGEEKHAHVYI
jgi:hypothetical protein